MRPSIALINNYESVIGILTRYPMLVNHRVFGSALHGNDREDSDLDLLVEGQSWTTLLDLTGLEYELTKLLKLPVHVHEPGEISQYFRETVISEACPLADFVQLRLMEQDNVKRVAL